MLQKDAFTVIKVADSLLIFFYDKSFVTFLQLKQPLLQLPWAATILKNNYFTETLNVKYSYAACKTCCNCFG